VDHEDPEVTSATQAIVRDIERVVDLSDALTTLAWLDAEPPPQLETVNLDALARDELERASSTFPEHEFLLEGSGGTAISDHALVTRIISNLLNNAGKYTPPGSRVQLTLTETDDTKCIQVSDNGPGISADESERIFDRFHRGSNAVGLQGTGLGLAIVKAAAERLGGKVTLDPCNSESCGLAVSVEISAKLSEISQDGPRE
jgi:two-component system sensor histidine kinase MprB